MNLIRTSIVALLVAGAAGAAQAETASAPERAERAPSDDEALAIAALEGLMTQPAERALPLLKKVLAGSQPTIVKRRALFVLSQIEAPEARDLLLQTARAPNSALRAEAIRSIGIGGDPATLDALLEIYKTGDEDARAQILKAWMIAGRKSSIYQAALNAKSEDEANEAIKLLGVMGATEELRKLGERPGNTSSLMEAMALSGDIAGLRKIAEGTGPRETRIDATRRIGIVHNEAARTALREIYTKSQDAEIRDAALQGMLIAEDEQGVLALYRAAKTPDEKRSLLRTLTVMGGDAALQAIDATLEKKP